MNNYLKLNTITHAVKTLKKGGIIAYPTESVFGIGCDPDNELAVSNLLKLKNRSIEKGLILIAANFTQLIPYVDISSLVSTQWKTVSSYWPGPTTFIFPKKSSTPSWLTGRFDSIAIRVTNHQLVARLCHTFGKPLVSTSANLTGLKPCRTFQEVQDQFGDILQIIDGKTDGQLNPSKICDILTGKYLR